MSDSISTAIVDNVEEGDPESPTSAALAALNMTRDDLARHTRQMRSFLSTSAPSLHVLSQNSQDVQRATLEAVLERNDSRKKKRDSSSSSRHTFQDASSQCSSVAYQQDVFYSRPASVAPSAGTSHPSLRRSQSISSSHMSSEFDQDDLDAGSVAASQLYSRASSSFSNIGSLRTDASYSTHPSTSTSATADLAHEGAVTPHKQSRYPQIDLGSTPKYDEYDEDDLSTSPKFGLPPPTSSPVDPRTPFRHHHHLALSRHAVNPLSSPVHSSSPQHGDTSPTNMPFTLPAGPRLTTKPHYSYAALIGQALMAAVERRLSLNQIYTWISMAYPYFKRGEAGWQNSIRHNLSLNGCFVKMKRDDGEKGKGSWWAIREGDEMCFAGGGFQRQGRAGGRKRKGKADVGKSETEDVDQSGTGHHYQSVSPTKPGATNEDGTDSADEAGASPKKKKKTMTSKAAAAAALASKQKAGVMMHQGIPSGHNATYANAAAFYTMAYPTAAMNVPPRQHPLAHLVPPYVAGVYDPQSATITAVTTTAPVLTPAPSEPPKRATTHVRMHANTSGYLLRPIGDFSSSPAPMPQGHHRSEKDNESDGEADVEATTETGTTSNREKLGQGTNQDEVIPNNEEESERLDEQDTPNNVLLSKVTLADSPLASRTTVTFTALGKPITLAGECESPTTTTVLQPGFTFTPSGKSTSTRVKTEDDDAMDAHEDMDDQPPHHTDLFLSSPVPPRRTQRHNPLYRGPSHISTHKRSNNRSSLMNPGTDLLSRVLDSKAANKKNSKRESPSMSSHQQSFPRPTTPVRDARPSTPPPKRPASAYQSKDDEMNGEQGSNAKVDPTLAAAVALASLSPMRTPVSHAAYHMSPVAPPSSDLLHYKHNLGPPLSPFRTPKSSPTKESSVKGGLRTFDYYDYMGGGDSTSLTDDFMDRGFASSTPGRSTMGMAALLKTPATPVGSGGGGGLFGSSSLYQSPSLPSPGWRRY